MSGREVIFKTLYRRLLRVVGFLLLQLQRRSCEGKSSGVLIEAWYIRECCQIHLLLSPRNFCCCDTLATLIALLL